MVFWFQGFNERTQKSRTYLSRDWSDKLLEIFTYSYYNGLKNGGGFMKKTTKITAWILSAVSYASFLSLAFYSFIYAFTIHMGFFGDEPANFPRFYPFCNVVCFFALIALGLTAFLNVRFAKKLNFKNVTWILQWVLSLVTSAPMVLFWAYVFNFLQVTF